ncbi:hypothetical protein QTP88_001778 [Uroleucon formosanum]
MLFLNDTTTPRTTESNISDTFPTENSVHDDNLFERNVDYEIPDTRDTVNADPEYNITLNNNSCVPSSPKSVKSILNSGQDVSDTEIVVDSPAKVANPTKKMKKTYGNSFEDQLLELEREKNNKISALLKNQLDNSENDEDMYFFKSLLPHFKKMNSIQKLRMRNQFQAIIINELQSTQTNQRPLLTTASVPYHYDTAGTSYSYPSSSSSAASYYPSHNPEFVEYTNNLQPNIGIQSCQNNSGCAKYGFIPNSKLVFRSNTGNSTDYHSQMNSELFKSWFTQMLNNLEEPSVIIMNNASYHSTLIDNYPKSNAKKADVQEWLTKKNIKFSPLETLAELKMRVKALIPNEKKYELDQLALEMGHEVIRLPPYHCQYNPIELILAQVKCQVAKNNKTFKMCDIERLTHEALDSVTQHDWEKCVRHAEELQDKDNEKEIMRDALLEPIILTLLPDDSDWDDSDDEENAE